MTNDEGHLAVDFVGRHERLAEDFRLVERTIGLPAMELPRLQVAREPLRYAALYTAETLRLVTHRYARDLDMFGYVFDAG